MNTKQKPLPRLHQPYGSREFYVVGDRTRPPAMFLDRTEPLDDGDGLTPEEVDRFGRLFGCSQDLLSIAERLVCALKTHIKEDSRRTKIPEEEYCPCLTNEIAEALKIIARAKGEED